MEGALAIFLSIGLPIICGTLLMLSIPLTIIYLQRSKRQTSQEDTQLLQEMHQSLMRMEKRIDALETIYFESETKKKS